MILLRSHSPLSALAGFLQANADAAAKTSGGGAEASGEGTVSGDIEVYSMTEAGLALQATVKGTKYWQDDSLN